jgi:dihydrofolate synthase/folylpolyglutamate synthase
MQVDGEPISTDELTAALDAVRQAEEQLPSDAAGVTFFEVATAVGFLHFARRGVEVGVIEVGLGGRFDSTNVCSPLVALITSISYDHTHLLGDKLASIAREKAGIIKPGHPTVSGVTAPEAEEVIVETCRERGSPLRQLGRDFTLTYEPGKVTADSDRQPRVAVVTAERTWPAMDLGLLGAHQAANAAVAVACVEEMRQHGLPVPDTAVVEGLAGVVWPARLEVLGRRPLVVLDCAHNVASARALVETLEESFPPGRRLLIAAISSDKDVPGILQALAPSFSHAFLTRYVSNPRSVAPKKMGEMLERDTQLPFTICDDPAAAWKLAREMARPEDLICATGSVFLAGELRPLLLAP